MTVTVRLFASLREKAGFAQATRSIDDGATAGDLVATLRAEYPALADMGRVAIAVNSEYVDPLHRLSDGDEVALIPPVSGGVGRRARRAVPARAAGEPCAGVARGRLRRPGPPGRMR